MNDTERLRQFDKAFQMCINLYSTIEGAGGNASLILRNYMDRPLRDFLANVAAPNYIRFQYKPDIDNVHKD